MIWDLVIVEGGGGGDFTMSGNDLAVCHSIETSVYLSMFGGNVKADTKNPRPDQDFSYWANGLFLPANQLNSLTERTLNNTPLTSAGRATIQNAITKDLAFLSPTNVTVVIVSTDRINVSFSIVLQSGLPIVVRFSLVRNAITGDFDLTDFDFTDFF